MHRGAGEGIICGRSTEGNGHAGVPVGRASEVGRGADLDLVVPEGHFEVADVAEPVKLVRMAARWGDDVGGSGLFRVDAADKRQGPSWS